MKKGAPKGRNPAAYALALRGKGKVMKDRRSPRGPSRSTKRDVERALADEGVTTEGYPEYDPEEDDILRHFFEEDEWDCGCPYC